MSISATAKARAPVRIGRVTMRAVTCIRRRPTPMPSRRGGEGPRAPNSTASRPAWGRTVRRQCRAATRRPRGDHGCRALPHGDARERRAASEAEARARSRGENTTPRAADRHDGDRDEDRDRRRRPYRAQARRAATARVQVRRGGAEAARCHPARRCGSTGRPIGLAGSEDRQAAAPTARAERQSASRHRPTGARRPAGDRSRICQAAARKQRPQGDHLLASGWSRRSTSGRRDRRAASMASRLARRAAGPAVSQSARKSGLRRSHSHAKSRAVSGSNAR